MAWQFGSRAGIRFLQPMECSALVRKIVKGYSDGTTRAPRLPVNHSGRLTSASGSFSMIVGNICQRGMNICHSGQLQVGTVVDVSLKNGVKVRSIVRWSAGFFAGIELSGLLPLDHLGRTREPLIPTTD